MKGEEGNGVSAGSGNKLRKRRFRSIVELGQWPKKDADWCPDFRRRQHSTAATIRVEKLTPKKRQNSLRDGYMFTGGVEVAEALSAHGEPARFKLSYRSIGMATSGN
ncbi:hypothetical protein Y032_0024g1000 [Ancylostoma ceylanicum]|uniref:Uncharacterized protein n=1 Tax=Ancylostoma ceylanicum TaxID=53326 RepID=A0A016UV30_9BILA|nr:hypothetical protein Y032_0024g1000 [Ancylostoma ceylanicum]